VAICDVDAAMRKNASATVEKAYAARAASGEFKGVTLCNDFREVMARPDVDAVLIATPDHWHTLISLAALKAGKDVYCEKPLTLTIAEGRILADAARRYGRVFQTGSQQRSSQRFRFACELVRNGRIGKLQAIKVVIPPGRATTVQPAQPVPEGFDYDTWLGPAPWEPYTELRCHYNFRFILDYSGGQVTNFGAHDLDIAQWALDMDTAGPTEVEGRGIYPTDGLYTTPVSVDFTFTYANGVKLNCKTGSSLCRFEGTDGWVEVDRGKIVSGPANLVKTVLGPGEVHLYESKDHWTNFLDCVRTRRPTICPAETGHRSATCCHLANIAMQLERKLKWDPAAERFVNDPEADRLISRSMRGPWQL